MKNVFVDTDIVLDLLAERQPNYPFAAQLFTLSDKGKVTLSVSSVTFTNLNYILAKKFSNQKARQILTTFKVLVKILSVDEKIVELASTYLERFSLFRHINGRIPAAESGILNKNTFAVSLETDHRPLL